MKNILRKTAATALILLLSGMLSFAQSPKFKVLALYSTTVEADHVDFARDATTSTLKWLCALAVSPNKMRAVKVSNAFLIVNDNLPIVFITGMRFETQS